MMQQHCFSASPPTDASRKASRHQHRLRRLHEHIQDVGVAERNLPLPAAVAGGVGVEIEHLNEGVAVLLLAKPPVNSFDQSLGNAVVEALEGLKRDDSVKALVIMSKNPKVVSGGLDLNVVYQPEKQKFMGLWRAFEASAKTVWTFPKPVIFALAGNSPAAGAVFSIFGDYRFASEDTKIGFNEAQLHLALPEWLLAIGERVVGGKHADRMLQQGPMMSALEAEKIGLIDEVAKDYGATKDLAVAKAAALGKIWTGASVDNKARQHAPIAAMFGEKSMEFMWEQFSADRTQRQFAKFFKKE